MLLKSSSAIAQTPKLGEHAARIHDGCENSTLRKQTGNRHYFFTMWALNNHFFECIRASSLGDLMQHLDRSVVNNLVICNGFEK